MSAPSSGGNPPFSPLSGSMSMVTWLPVQVTPYQVQGVLVASQPLLTTQVGPLVLL